MRLITRKHKIYIPILKCERTQITLNLFQCEAIKDLLEWFLVKDLDNMEGHDLEYLKGDIIALQKAFSHRMAKRYDEYSKR